MTDEKKPFTVTDRRHFTPEGRSRAEDDTHEEPAAEAGGVEPTPGPAGPPESSAPQSVTDSEEPPGGEDEFRSPFPADFGGLLLSLAAQASLLLGIGLAGVADAPQPDFQGARAVISLLEVLKEKTEGRRTPEEERILEGILYELRMAYVARTRAGGA